MPSGINAAPNLEAKASRFRVQKRTAELLWTILFFLTWYSGYRLAQALFLSPDPEAVTTWAALFIAGPIILGVLSTANELFKEVEAVEDLSSSGGKSFGEASPEGAYFRIALAGCIGAITNPIPIAAIGYIILLFYDGLLAKRSSLQIDVFDRIGLIGCGLFGVLIFFLVSGWILDRIRGDSATKLLERKKSKEEERANAEKPEPSEVADVGVFLNPSEHSLEEIVKIREVLRETLGNTHLGESPKRIFRALDILLLDELKRRNPDAFEQWLHTRIGLEEAFLDAPAELFTKAIRIIFPVEGKPFIPKYLADYYLKKDQDS